MSFIERLRGRRDRFLWAMFPFWERLGIHLLPVHFYSPLPDTHVLAKKRPLLERAHAMPGVDLREEEQVRFLREVVARYENEYVSAGQEASGRRAFGLEQAQMPSFAPLNGLMLYAMVRHFRPRKVVEVGAGISTRISAAALAHNGMEGAPGELTVIEPYPSPELERGAHGMVTLRRTPVEEVEESLFTELEAGDILFIDSTHTVKPLGDVVFLFLSVLPRLRPGVVVHIHDIFLPVDYLPHHFFRAGARQFWQEQYLLQAFLVHNREFEILLGSSFLHLNHLTELRSLFPWYHVDRWPSSFWIRRRIKDASEAPAI